MPAVTMPASGAIEDEKEGHWLPFRNWEAFQDLIFKQRPRTLHKEDEPMTSRDLEAVAQTLVAEGKGILAADETVPTLTRRFDTLGIHSTEESRRNYREMLFTSPGAAEFISGVIMYDETIRQKSSGGIPLVEALTAGGIPPGIKVEPARSLSPASLMRPSPKALMVYGIV
jgi:hypothetical protein